MGATGAVEGPLCELALGNLVLKHAKSAIFIVELDVTAAQWMVRQGNEDVITWTSRSY